MPAPDLYDTLARNECFVRLGVAVIRQAIFDASWYLPTPDPLAARNRHETWRERIRQRTEARTFLTAANDLLEFWCMVAGLHTDAVLYYARRAERTDRWVAMGQHFHHLRKAAA